MFNRKTLKACFAPLAIMALFLAFHDHAYAIGSIDEVVQQAAEKLRKAFGSGLSAVCYIGGGSLVLGSIYQLYRMHRHDGSASRQTYGATFIVLICGIALLGFPHVVGMGSQTAFNGNTSITGEQQQLKFNE